MLKDSKVKAKIFCMGGGKTKDVTRLYRYATRLNECNIRIWENNYGMTYVVHNGRITLKSVTSFLKYYILEQEMFLFLELMKMPKRATRFMSLMKTILSHLLWMNFHVSNTLKK